MVDTNLNKINEKSLIKEDKYFAWKMFVHKNSDCKSKELILKTVETMDILGNKTVKEAYENVKLIPNFLIRKVGFIAKEYFVNGEEFYDYVISEINRPKTFEIRGI